MATPSEIMRWSDEKILDLVVKHNGRISHAESAIGLRKFALTTIIIDRGLLKTLRKRTASFGVPGSPRTLTKKEIRDAYAKADGSVREVRRILHLTNATLRREMHRLGIEGEIAKRWKKRQHGGERDAGEVRQIDVARATGRTRAAVSAAIAKGRTVQDLLRTPKGERVATPHDSIYREIEVEHDAFVARGDEAIDDWRALIAGIDTARMWLTPRRDWLKIAAVALRATESIDRKAPRGQV